PLGNESTESKDLYVCSPVRLFSFDGKATELLFKPYWSFGLIRNRLYLQDYVSHRAIKNHTKKILDIRLRTYKHKTPKKTQKYTKNTHSFVYFCVFFFVFCVYMFSTLCLMLTNNMP